MGSFIGHLRLDQATIMARQGDVSQACRAAQLMLADIPPSKTSAPSSRRPQPHRDNGWRRTVPWLERITVSPPSGGGLLING